MRSDDVLARMDDHAVRPPPDDLDLARRHLRATDQRSEDELRVPWFRVSIAGVGLFVLGLLLLGGLPAIGMRLPPYVIGLVFATIIVGVVMANRGERRAAGLDDDDRPAGSTGREGRALSERTDADGRPVGCCAGPRPMRCLRDR